MKSIILGLFLGLLTFSVSQADEVEAGCLAINSSFQCEKNPDDATDTGAISITTTVNQGATFYLLTDKDNNEQATYPADNKVYTQDGQTYKGWCGAKDFTMLVTGKDPQYGTYEYKVSYSLDSAGNLLEKGYMNLKDYNHQIAIDSTCTKL